MNDTDAPFVTEDNEWTTKDAGYEYGPVPDHILSALYRAPDGKGHHG